MSKYSHLFSSIRIGRMKLKNRLVLAALNSKLGTENGAVSDRYIEFLVERAKGGVGLLIIENTCVDWSLSRGGSNPIRADRVEFIPGLNDLVEAVHAHGANVATQLQHVGSQANPLFTGGNPKPF